MAKKCLDFEFNTLLLHMAHFDGHIKDVQKIPVVLSSVRRNCRRIGILNRRLERFIRVWACEEVQAMLIFQQLILKF